MAPLSETRAERSVIGGEPAATSTAPDVAAPRPGSARLSCATGTVTAASRAGGTAHV